MYLQNLKGEWYLFKLFIYQHVCLKQDVTINNIIPKLYPAEFERERERERRTERKEGKVTHKNMLGYVLVSSPFYWKQDLFIH